MLAQLGRDKGKLKEPLLFQIWGGKPTTQILRHTNNHLNSVTKSRYYSLLFQKINTIRIPTLQMELNDPKAADEVYESCAKFLIAKTRDTKNIHYYLKITLVMGFDGIC